jgi:hypothetical protein
MPLPLPLRRHWIPGLRGATQTALLPTAHVGKPLDLAVSLCIEPLLRVNRKRFLAPAWIGH